MDTEVSPKLFIGIDMHKRQWSVSIFTLNCHHKTFSQAPYPMALKAYLDKFFPKYQITCCYEACKFGFWIYRELKTFGYECLVINPADLPTTNKESSEKTDPVDSRKMANVLRAGLLTGIHVPSLETEGDRQLFRYRKRLWADLVRVKNRIKDKLLQNGIETPPKHDNPYWTKDFLDWLAIVELPSGSSRLVMDLLLDQFEYTYRHFLKVSIAVRALQRKEKYKANSKLLRQIPGIGPLTTVQLLTEIEDVKRFRNFKHFNSYIGLKPMVHSSGESDRKGYMTYRHHQAPGPLSNAML